MSGGRPGGVQVMGPIGWPRSRDTKHLLSPLGRMLPLVM